MDGALRPEAGGIAGLHALLAEHGEAIEWDLSHYHHRELGELFTGTLTWRKLRSFLSHLPRESALARKLLGEDAPWGLNEQLLAMTIDVLRQGNWQRGGGKGAKPKPLPRPGAPRGSETRHGRTDRDPDQVIAYLDRFRPQSA
ncbi:hypothetical protein ACGFNP_25210 [Nonomuraea sp. NPDC049269]|uniref:hypothetical protein n=1 Tax=Nonomuraea sp. NPDC049269 TaxID=3364349 RepID=UPI003716080C